MKTIGAVIIVLIILIAGGAYFGYTYYENSQNTGHVAISVADAPMPGVSGVYITFSAVGIHSNTSGWVNYSVSTHTVDILNLTATNASLLANISLHPATYTMIRLYITKVTVDMLGIEVNFTLNAPFAFINHPFKVSAHSTQNIMIDFNLNQDMNLNAKIFTPNVGFTVQSA